MLIIKLVLAVLQDIVSIVIQGIIISFIGKICWNHIASLFQLPLLQFFDVLAIWGVVWCICKTIKIGLLYLNADNLKGGK
jgi:hypothetical protein